MIWKLTVEVWYMNIIVEIIVGLKRAPECIKTHHFEGEHAKIFLGRGCATPTEEGDTPGRGVPFVPSPDPTPCWCLRHLHSSAFSTQPSIGVPHQNFWVGQICRLRLTFYKRFMAYNSQHWDWGQTKILYDVCKIQ